MTRLAEPIRPIRNPALPAEGWPIKRVPHDAEAVVISTLPRLASKGRRG